MGGCFGGVHQTNTESINLHVKRMRHYIDIEVQKQIKECTTLEKMLLYEFSKQNCNRAMAAQDSITGQIVKGTNRIHILTVVKHECNKIMEYSHHMDNKQKANETLFPSFRTILYSESILADFQVSKACKLIRKNYPKLKQADDAMIDSQIMRHHKVDKEPNHVMKNNYILNLCSQEHLSMEKINAAGHKFKYGL